MIQSYPPVTTKNPQIEQVSKTIVELAQRDQSIRVVFEKDKSEKVREEMRKTDENNREVFKKLFKKTGLIDSKYEEKVQFSAFLIVQHMPRSEVKFMKKYLSLMKRNLEGFDINNFAQLCDRVETWQNKPQIYGTQFMPVEGKENTYKLKELYKPKEVDNRRLKLGLEPLEEYMRKLEKERNVFLIL